MSCPHAQIVMNIPSYGGGVRLWQQQQPDPNFVSVFVRLLVRSTVQSPHSQPLFAPPQAPQSFSDGLLELLSVSDLLSLALQLGL